jgi:hypothetical protein
VRLQPRLAAIRVGPTRSPITPGSSSAASTSAIGQRENRFHVARIDPKRSFRKLIAPGGPVWLDVEIASANRDGEITRVEALQQKRDEAEVVADMVVLVEEHRLIAGMAAVRRRRSDIRPGA